MPRPWRIANTFFALGLALAAGGLACEVHAGEFLDDRLGGRTAPILLLMRSDVQADLKLEPAQVAEARRTAGELYYKARALRGQSGPALVAARRAIDSEESVWLSRHLSELQFKRLRQIDLQWEGPAAMLNRPFVGEYLGLSPEQGQAIARRLARHTRTPGGQPRWTTADHERLTREVMMMLSEHQRQLWYNLLGPSCRFSIATSPENALPAHARSSAPAGASALR